MRERLVRVPLKEAIDLNPKWSPDGKSILYVTGRDPVTVWMMDPEGNQRTRLFKRKGRFLGLGWDPDRG